MQMDSLDFSKFTLGQKPPLRLVIYNRFSALFKFLRKITLNLTDAILFWGNGKPASPISAIVMRFGHALRIFGLSLAERPVRDLFLLSTAAGNGQLQTVLFLGEKKRLRNAVILFFDSENYSINYLGRCYQSRYSEICRYAGNAVDIIFLESPRGWNWKVNQAEWLDAPLSIRMQLDLRRVLDQNALEQAVHSNHKNIRKVRKEGFTSIISHEAADFDLFFDHMYVPTLQAHFGEWDFGRDKDYYRQLFTQGFLVIAAHPLHGKIAASLCTIKDKVFYAVICGMLDGEEQWRFIGGLSALYWFEMNEAVSRKLAVYDAGEVMAMEQDGLFIHKRKWGLTCKANPWLHQSSLLVIPEKNSRGLAWLRNHRFIPAFAKWSGAEIDRVITGNDGQ
jgi:hypothetical protein